MIPEILAILFYGIGDLWTTKISINMGLKEQNPLVRTILKKTGFAGLIVFKGAIISMFIVDFPTMLLVLVGFGLFCTAWNIRQMIKYQQEYLMSKGIKVE
jgi:hypothetical protein